MLKDKLDGFELELLEELLKTIEQIYIIVNIGKALDFSLFAPEVLQHYFMMASKMIYELKEKGNNLLDADLEISQI